VAGEETVLIPPRAHRTHHATIPGLGDTTQIQPPCRVKKVHRKTWGGKGNLRGTIPVPRRQSLSAIQNNQQTPAGRSRNGRHIDLTKERMRCSRSQYHGSFGEYEGYQFLAETGVSLLKRARSVNAIEAYKKIDSPKSHWNYCLSTSSWCYHQISRVSLYRRPNQEGGFARQYDNPSRTECRYELGRGKSLGSTSRC